MTRLPAPDFSVLPERLNYHNCLDHSCPGTYYEATLNDSWAGIVTCNVCYSQEVDCFREHVEEWYKIDQTMKFRAWADKVKLHVVTSLPVTPQRFYNAIFMEDVMRDSQIVLYQLKSRTERNLALEELLGQELPGWRQDLIPTTHRLTYHSRADVKQDWV